MDRKKFCQKLKRARVEAGMKQEDIARLLNLPISAISVMESGTRKIDVLELMKLSKYYNKPIEWFFHEHNSTQKRRWYDLDPVVSEAVELLRVAPTKLQKNTAYGILGFLKNITPCELEEDNFME
ncbi:MAG: helix-turn-helix transcriptional regulator [bacterium]